MKNICIIIYIKNLVKHIFRHTVSYFSKNCCIAVLVSIPVSVLLRCMIIHGEDSLQYARNCIPY